MDRPFTKNDPPVHWEFSGHAAAQTTFKLNIFGRPGVRALTNIIRQLELYREFVRDDPAESGARGSEPSCDDGNLPPADPLPLDMDAHSQMGEGS